MYCTAPQGVNQAEGWAAAAFQRHRPIVYASLEWLCGSGQACCTTTFRTYVSCHHVARQFPSVTLTARRHLIMFGNDASGVVILKRVARNIWGAMVLLAERNGPGSFRSWVHGDPSTDTCMARPIQGCGTIKVCLLTCNGLTAVAAGRGRVWRRSGVACDGALGQSVGI